MCAFIHFWAKWNKYFISKTNLPRETQAEEILNEMMNEPELPKEESKMISEELEI